MKHLFFKQVFLLVGYPQITSGIHQYRTKQPRKPMDRFRDGPIGYRVTPDWLVYGLVGWSWGGFEWDIGAVPFTLNGFTYGAGVEKDFGWSLCAFVQYKGISYGSKGDRLLIRKLPAANFRSGELHPGV